MVLRTSRDRTVVRVILRFVQNDNTVWLDCKVCEPQVSYFKVKLLSIINSQSPIHNLPYDLRHPPRRR